MSVVLMVDRRRERGARALASLLRQTILERLEIVLLDFGGPTVAPLPGTADPHVRMIRLRRGLPYGFAKLIGFRAARAPVVAFVEEHCRYAPQWAEAILAEFHDSAVGAVCGEMHNACPESWMSDAISIATTGPWTVPARSGPAPAVAANNSAYQRALLERWTHDLDRLLGAEPLLQARVRAAGYQLRIVAEAEFDHEFGAVLWDYLAPRFLHDWVFAATLTELDAWSWPRRILEVAQLPARLVARAMVKPVRLGRRPGIGLRILPMIPVIVVGEAAALAGRGAGLLFGRGRAEMRCLACDLNVRRSAAS